MRPRVENVHEFWNALLIADADRCRELLAELARREIDRAIANGEATTWWESLSVDEKRRLV